MGDSQPSPESVNKSNAEKDPMHGGAFHALLSEARFVQYWGCTGNGLLSVTHQPGRGQAETGAKRPLQEVNGEQFGERPQFGLQ